MSVNRHLLLVVLSALLPLLLVAAVLAYVLVDEKREATEHLLEESAQRLAQSLDGELERSLAALEGLSHSASLRSGDLKAFYAEAGALRDKLRIWDNVILLSPSAEHLLNLARPYGVRLPPVPQPQGTLAAAATRKPYFSNAIKGRVETDWLVYIAYPAIHDGEVKYVLGVTMSYRYWTKWLSERAPAGMTAGIIDGDHVILARTRDPERVAGQPVQDWYRRVLSSSVSGLARGAGVSDTDVVVAYHRSPLSGWYVNVLTTGAALDAPMRRTALLVSLAVLAALLIAVTLALRRGAVLTRGIRALQEALESLRGPAPRVPPARSEISEVRSAMQAAQHTAEVLATRQAQLLESESKFRTISHAMPAIVWVTDDDGIVFINERWPELTGQSPERALGQGWTAMVHPDDDERLSPLRERCRRTGETYEGEIRYRTRDGHYRWHAFRAVPAPGVDGRIEQWFGCAVDIHDAKEAQEALKEADRRKDEFLATLSHELRNPLAPIRNALYFLNRRADEDPAVRAAQEMMDRQVTHMVRLIDDLLDVSRITRGRLQLRREPVALEKVVEQALETSRPHLVQRLTVALPSEPVFLDADPVRLAQVLSNLLNNAAKYTPKSGHVRLSAALQDGEVVLRVKDDGIGIAREQLPDLFRIFSQASEAIERSQGGLGIGLALARSLVELHGGTIEAFSEGPGTGSEFVVRLPALATPDPAQARPPKKSAAYSGAVRRVLVVDDVEDSARSLAALLRMDGNEVETAADGLQAVGKAESFKPDLILMDLGLPNLGGVEACELIRRQPWGRGIVIAAMTGWGQDEDRRRTREAGFDAHLVKPVHYEAVRALLASPLMA
ncbi:MAG TPA: ATP-binding protein [Burkholderiales bacterium]|nr:ATP-binding protein [Burkholderiales bacterium]